eukprot:sb/3479547/
MSRMGEREEGGFFYSCPVLPAATVGVCVQIHSLFNHLFCHIFILPTWGRASLDNQLVLPCFPLLSPKKWVPDPLDPGFLRLWKADRRFPFVRASVAVTEILYQYLKIGQFSGTDKLLLLQQQRLEPKEKVCDLDRGEEFLGPVVPGRTITNGEEEKREKLTKNFVVLYVVGDTCSIQLTDIIVITRRGFRPQIRVRLQIYSWGVPIRGRTNAFLKYNNNNIPRLYTAHTRRKHVKILTMFRRVIRAVYPRLNIFHTHEHSGKRTIWYDINTYKTDGITGPINLLIITHFTHTCWEKRLLGSDLLACQREDDTDCPQAPQLQQTLHLSDWRRCLVLFLHGFPITYSECTNEEMCFQTTFEGFHVGDRPKLQGVAHSG